MYEADVDMNVGCDGFQIWNAVIHWFQSWKLRGVLCANADYLMKQKTHFSYFYDLRIIRRADYQAEITVFILKSSDFGKKSGPRQPKLPISMIRLQQLGCPIASAGAITFWFAQPWFTGQVKIGKYSLYQSYYSSFKHQKLCLNHKPST